MIRLTVVAVMTAVLAAAGTAGIVLLRSGSRSWHAGDPLPHVPPDAPLRTWHDRRSATLSAAAPVAVNHDTT